MPLFFSVCSCLFYELQKTVFYKRDNYMQCGLLMDPMRMEK